MLKRLTITCGTELDLHCTHTNEIVMKKLIVLAMFGISLASFKQVHAQVSINVNIGTPAYYTAPNYNGYNVPAHTVIYPSYYKKNVIIHNSQPYIKRNTYYANYRPSPRQHAFKRVENGKHYKNFKNGNHRGYAKGKQNSKQFKFKH
jgi:hypothetical protein